MNKPILQVKDLHFAYDDSKLALDGINVSIHQGERIAVIGSNGAGKSTFFLNLNGVLSPTQGEILYHGTKITKKNLRSLRQNIGIVFQDADNQIIASSVMAEVSFGPMNLKLPRAEVLERVNTAMDYMNITPLKDRPPHYLSGGEKKRVSIADIIAMKSEIIIFDEPTASLDPLNADMLEEVLEKLTAEGKTLLISTHDVDFAYRFADRVLVFHDGGILADGTPLDVFQMDSIIKKANLKKPILLDMYEMLVKSRLLPDTGSYPRNVKEFQACISSMP